MTNGQDRDEALDSFRRKQRVEQLTLVFTDIEDSTRNKQQWGERIAATVMQRHNALVRELPGAISFEAVAGRQAQAMFALLPEALRSQHGSVERFVASVMAQEPPSLAARVIEEKLIADRMLVAIRVQNQDGREKIARYTMKRADDGWRLEVPLPVVHAIAKQMGVALQALN